MKRRRRDAAPVVTTAIGRRLSEGGLVQASVRARLLGIPLLRLDATVALIPGPVPIPSGSVPGRSLAEAVRRINEGAEILTHVRRDSRALPPRAASNGLSRAL